MNRSMAGSPDRKPHLLLVAYAFPPSPAVGGLRAWYMAKHLSRRGWRVTVATPDPRLIESVRSQGEGTHERREDGVELLLTEHGLGFLMEGFIKGRPWEKSLPVRAVARLLWRYLGVPRELGWAGPLLRTCRTLSSDEIDVVLATGPPHFSFRVSLRIARLLRAACVVDYRDLWVDNPHGRVRLKVWRRRIERKVLREADGVITASPTMLEILKDRIGRRAHTAVLLNGFDPDDLDPIQPSKFDEAAVVYAGSIYPPKNSITPILRAIALRNAAAASNGRPMRLHYFGPASVEVQAEARSVGEEAQLIDHGIVPRAEVIAAVKGATAIAVVTTVFPTQTLAEQTIVTSKLFEAIGARSRVLLIAPPGSDARGVLARYGVGAAFRGDEVEAIAEWLGRLAGPGEPSTAAAADEFGWPAAVVGLDRFLREIVSARSRPVAAGGSGTVRGETAPRVEAGENEGRVNG